MASKEESLRKLKLNKNIQFFKNIDEVRQGKYFEIDVKENDPSKAKVIVEEFISFSNGE